MTPPPTSRPDDHAGIALRGISKRFPGVAALTDVSLTLPPGEIHALLGENGAGKSTLINILSGAFPPDSGTVLVDGTPVSLTSPEHAQELGIKTIHQELLLAPDLTALQNIYLGHEIRGAGGLRGLFLDEHRMKANIADLCSEFGLFKSDLDRPTAELSALKQRVVGVVRALASQARLVIMDEPTSGLADHERDSLFEHMSALRASGIAILWVTHRLDEVDLADRSTVLRDGQYVDTVAAADATPEVLLRMMVGRETRSLSEVVGDTTTHRAEARRTPELLRVEGLSTPALLRDISFSLREREVVGVAGLVGAGRTELARALCGADRTSAGTVYLKGKRCTIKSPRSAFRHGIAMVPEERKTDAIFAHLPISDNISMAALSRVALGRCFLSRRRERKVASDSITQLGIRAVGTRQKIATLSGGNQQKVIIARYFFTKPSLLIFDEPTQGVDAGARPDIYQLVFDFVRSGGAALIICSEMEELLTVSDRVLVMREGRLAGEVSTTDGDRTRAEAVMALATRGQEPEPAGSESGTSQARWASS